MKQPPDSQNIFLILKGKVIVFEEMAKKKSEESRNKMISHKTIYTAGESFGVKEFFCGTSYEFTAQSK